MVSVCLPSDALCNTYHLTWVSLILVVGYLFMAAPAKHSHCSLPWTGVSPYPLLNGFMKTTRPFRTNTPKRYPFLYRGLECKSRKSRNIWSNRQIWPWNTERSRAKTNRVLPRECTGHSKHPLPTTQEKTLHMDVTRWSTPKSD